MRFNLIQATRAVAGCSDWLKIEILVKTNKLTSLNTNSQGELHEEYPPSQNNSSSFEVKLSKKASFLPGVLRTSSAGSSQIQEMKLKLQYLKQAPENLKIRLKQMNLTISDSKEKKENFSNYQIVFKNNLKSKGSFRSNSVKLAVLLGWIMLFTPLMLILLSLASCATSKATLSDILFAENDDGEMALEHLFAFDILEIARFAALFNLYSSIKNLFFVLLCLFFQITFENCGVKLIQILAREDKYDRNPMITTLDKKLTLLKFSQGSYWDILVALCRLLGCVMKEGEGRATTEKVVGFLWMFGCVFFPFLLEWLGHWVLVAGLIYCLVLLRYENPCLTDYLSFVGYFGCIILRFILFVTYYKAIAVEYYYLEPMLRVWGSLIYGSMSEYLATFGGFFVLSGSSSF